MQDIQLAVGTTIKQVRKRKGITQDQLAELAGLDRAHLYRLELGKQNMTLKTLKLIAEAPDIHPKELLRGFKP